MYYDVVDVEPVEHLRLRVKFRDGLKGEVLLHESYLEGVFQALRDPAVFAQVSCAAGFVEWPGELDLAPDAMHRGVKEQGVWELS